MDGDGTRGACSKGNARPALRLTVRWQWFDFLRRVRGRIEVGARQSSAQAPIPTFPRMRGKETTAAGTLEWAQPKEPG
jgi:hypothetical protein